MTQDSKQLWCVHHLGSDDLIPAPSKEAADKLKAEYDAWAATKHAEETSPHAPKHVFTVEPWPYSADAHARDMAQLQEQM